EMEIKIGGILLTFGVLTFFIQLLVEIQTIGLIISIIATLVGYGYLLKGLSYMNRGLALIISGLCFIIPLMVYSILTSNASIAWADLIITIYLILLVFCILIFILPGIYFIYYSFESDTKEYHGRLLSWLVGIIITTLFCTTIILVAGGAIVSSRPEVDFRSFFFMNFMTCLGLGFLVGILLIGLGILSVKAQVTGASIPMVPS
ncbi:MAG: hypothetical protein ACFFG0_26760, partial [Candidatus Thorarchaeota archaeon]